MAFKRAAFYENFLLPVPALRTSILLASVSRSETISRLSYNILYVCIYIYIYYIYTYFGLDISQTFISTFLSLVHVEFTLGLLPPECNLGADSITRAHLTLVHSLGHRRM